MKKIDLLIVFLLFIAVSLIAFKSCDSKPSKLEVQSNHSLKIDSIQKRITDSIVLVSEKKITKYQDSISIHQSNIKRLTSELNYYKSIVKDIRVIKIDSSSQVVSVHVVEYNALINKGNTCDSLINEYKIENKYKDSVIVTRTMELQAEANMNKSHEQALKDLIALEGKDKRKLKHAKSFNKKIPLITGIGVVIGFVLATFALR